MMILILMQDVDANVEVGDASQVVGEPAVEKVSNEVPVNLWSLAQNSRYCTQKLPKHLLMATTIELWIV
jgi:hypothetical protein